MGNALRWLALVGLACALGSAHARTERRVIVMVWDGLRPDMVDARDTPNLEQLRREGVEFADHHATFPTLTMINAASFATGAYPARHGFHGNVAYVPGAAGRDATGAAVDFRLPVFVEDYAILAALDGYYDGRLLRGETLFERVQRAGLATATIGKAGAAFLQDRKRGGIILDELHAVPAALAPADPSATARAQPPLLRDDEVGDPTLARTPTARSSNRWLVRKFLDAVLTRDGPQLAIVWLREPDKTEHHYGPGAPIVRDALRDQDLLLGELRARLRALKLEANTDLIVVSDHGHSTVSGPLAEFPPRAIEEGAPGAIDLGKGWSTSGAVRVAELIRRADPALEAYDDQRCVLAAALGSIKADGTRAYATRVDTDGSVCGTRGMRYSSAVSPIPRPAELGTRAIVVANNDGSAALYLPRHDPDTLRRAVRAMQSREEVGAIFVSQRRYPELPPGTLAMESVRIESGDERSPDAVVVLAHDSDAKIHGVPGTIFAGMDGSRGLHGSFGPRDVHAVLIAAGPGFKRGYRDPLPSGNVDLAPTIAALFGLDFAADGRVLDEALARGARAGDYSVETLQIDAKDRASDLVSCRATALDCSDAAPGKHTYRARVVGKTLRRGEERWDYFDRADAGAERRE